MISLDKFSNIVLSPDELRITKMMCQFSVKQFRAFGRDSFSTRVKDPRQSRHWKTFVNVDELFKKFVAIDIEAYFDAQIVTAKHCDKFCPPEWLTTRKSIERYLKYIKGKKIKFENLNESKFEDKCLEALKETAIFLEKLKFQLKLNNIYDILTYKEPGALIPKSFIHIMTGSISTPFLCISKSYAKFFNDLDKDVKGEFPNLNSLIALRQFIKSNHKLFKFCKAVFKDENNL